jgi:hypothetical protein
MEFRKINEVIKMDQEKFEELKNRCLEVENIAHNVPEVYLEVLAIRRTMFR